ncbi:MAG: hypothetical protein Q9157_005277 [Trypethelium eluteriae]
MADANEAEYVRPVLPSHLSEPRSRLLKTLSVKAAAYHDKAIDLMTRRLVASGRPSATVGLFFSIGHSTIVIVTSIVVAATASAVSKKFGAFSQVGGIIGTAVSAAFLIILGLMNAYILYKLVIQLQRVIDMHPDGEESFKIQGTGCLFQIFKKLFKLIDRPWKMYPLGVLFGLGFDTSSEIALLGISSIEASRGTSTWLILIFPCLFTAGMALLDTMDGALMMALYCSANLATDKIATLYYGCILTAITVIVAIVIGTIQLLSLIDSIASPDGKFWKGVEVAGDHYDIIDPHTSSPVRSISTSPHPPLYTTEQPTTPYHHETKLTNSPGGCICASFAILGVLSILCYRPWRRRIDRARSRRHRAPAPEVADGDHAGGTDDMCLDLTDRTAPCDIGDDDRGQGDRSAAVE